jgi:hypothetical protein
MSRRYRFIVLVLLVHLTACSRIGDFGNVLHRATETPLATRSLPATYTPTASPTAIPSIPATPTISEHTQQSALLPEFVSDADVFPDATRYDIELDVDFQPGSTEAHIEGIARIRYVNPLEKNLSNIVLMLWPNDEQYQAQMQAGTAMIDGELTIPQAIMDGKALRIDLRPSLAEGESVDLTIPFSLEVDSFHEGSPRRMGITEGVLLAPTFYPMIPRLVDGEWDAIDAPSAGDTTSSETAFYAVNITTPVGQIVVATGVEISSTTTPDGKQRFEYISGPVRDFAFAIGQWEKTSGTSGEVTLNVWALPQHAASAQTALRAARIQVNLLSEIVGPYPYPELDLVDAPYAFGGIEYPGLVFIGTMGTDWVTVPTVHEVAHQWFYALLGNDQIREPWLDEAMASFAEALYYERAYGLGQGTGYLSDIRARLRAVPDATQPIGLAVGEYASESDYFIFVYQKGTLFLEALRNKLGTNRFNDFLAAVYAQYRYGFMHAEDFQNAAEAVCACDLQDFFDLWVYEGGEIFPP